ncbi:protein NO VEIN domain-containing protein [Paenibacillus aquistagni]|uniref:protein NO VEIN domain-containing protein n=1 Tax=Paenibacillus aquistagni TaxID=1852522 RepID=UPI00145B0024|nr:DUF3883 domain-containing protein [Paenibacillus aquistagni]NMM53416.1 DUF3883 domain-containing protein [Paenibacillus aquistagni]
MGKKHKLALIIAYYLSKYNLSAITALGFKNYTNTFEEVGQILDVKPNTIKNMRDEFDPLHDNGRMGWYQRELRPSRMKVVEVFQGFSEKALTEIVKDILREYGPEVNRLGTEYVDLYLATLGACNDENHLPYWEISNRGITGKKAEDFFIQEFQSGNIEGFQGELKDRRNDGCGYDFEVGEHVFEVKGLAAVKGGLLFTDKEWSIARNLRERYILVFIKNFDDIPQIELVIDPYIKLSAVKRVQSSITVNWSIDASQI